MIFIPRTKVFLPVECLKNHLISHLRFTVSPEGILKTISIVFCGTKSAADWIKVLKLYSIPSSEMLPMIPS